MFHRALLCGCGPLAGANVFSQSAGMAKCLGIVVGIDGEGDDRPDILRSVEAVALGAKLSEFLVEGDGGSARRLSLRA